MIYVGIVKSIKEEHISGLYGRKKVDKDIKEKLGKYTNFPDLITILNNIPLIVFPFNSQMKLIGVLVSELIKWRLKELELVAPINIDDNVKKLLYLMRLYWIIIGSMMKYYTDYLTILKAKVAFLKK